MSFKSGVQEDYRHNTAKPKDTSRNRAPPPLCVWGNRRVRSRSVEGTTLRRKTEFVGFHADPLGLNAKTSGTVPSSAIFVFEACLDGEEAIETEIDGHMQVYCLMLARGYV